MILILAGALMAIVAMAITQVTKQIPYKPFNCEMCMTFWLSTIFAVLNYLPTECVVFIGMALLTRQTLWRLWPTMF
jgi:hypothetical protein